MVRRTREFSFHLPARLNFFSNIFIWKGKKSAENITFYWWARALYFQEKFKVKSISSPGDKKFSHRWHGGIFFSVAIFTFGFRLCDPHPLMENVCKTPVKYTRKVFAILDVTRTWTKMIEAFFLWRRLKLSRRDIKGVEKVKRFFLLLLEIGFF